MKLQTIGALAAALAGSLATGFAQDVFAPDLGILAPDGGFKATLSFSDTYAEKVNVSPGSSPITHEVDGAEKISAKIVANLTGFNFASEILADMPVGFTVGSLSFSGTLSDLLPQDANGNLLKPFNAAITSGTHFFNVQKLDVSGNGVTNAAGDPVMVKAGSVKFAWTTGSNPTLTITATISDLAEAAQDSTLDTSGTPLSDLNAIGLADKGDGTTQSLSFANEAIPITVTFGDAIGQRNSYGKGTTKTVYKSVDGTASPVNTASVVGLVDHAPPVLAVTLPANDGGAGAIDFTGTVVDLPPDTLGLSTPVVDVEAYVNDDGTYSNPIPADSVDNPDATGKAGFSFTGLLLNSGANTVLIVATDESGNVATFTAQVTSTQ